MKLQLICQPGLWSHLKAQMRRTIFLSSHAMGRIQFLETENLSFLLVIDWHLLPCGSLHLFFRESTWEELERQGTSEWMPVWQKSVFCNQILEETCHHFYLNMFIRSKTQVLPTLKGSILHNEWMPGDRAQILGSHFKVTCQNNLSPKLGAGENWPPCLLWRELWFRLYVQERN